MPASESTDILSDAGILLNVTPQTKRPTKQNPK